MATCKDCIHYPACKSCWCAFWEHQEMTEEDRCKMFKNKADYAEVKHGQWVVEAYDDDNRMLIIPYIEHQHSEPFCSNCGKRALLNGAEDYVTTNYCPNCGAKMDLKEGAENAD